MNVYKFILFLIVFLAVFVFSLDVEKIAEYKKPFYENIIVSKDGYIHTNVSFVDFAEADIVEQVIRSFVLKDLKQNLFAELDSRANTRFSSENQKLLENTIHEMIYSGFINIKYSKNIYVGMGFIDKTKNDVESSFYKTNIFQPNLGDKLLIVGNDVGSEFFDRHIFDEFNYFDKVYYQVSVLSSEGTKLIEIDKSIDYSTGYPAYHGQGQMVGIATKALETYLSSKTSFRGVSVQGYQDSYGIIL